MRTAEEYIAGLDHNECHTILFVGFKSTTIFIDSYDDNRLQALKDAMANGGHPFGFSRINADTSTIEMGLLPESEDDKHLAAVLEQLHTEMVRLMKLQQLPPIEGKTNKEREYNARIHGKKDRKA